MQYQYDMYPGMHSDRERFSDEVHAYVVALNDNNNAAGQISRDTVVIHCNAKETPYPIGLCCELKGKGQGAAHFTVKREN